MTCNLERRPDVTTYSELHAHYEALREKIFDLPEKDATDAPSHLGADEAHAWANGYNAALDEIKEAI